MNTILPSAAALALCLAAGGPARPASPAAERVQAVRQKYLHFPCEILGLSEPVVVRAWGIRDGGSLLIEVKDARGKKLTIRLDRRLRTRTRDALYVSTPTKKGEVLLPARGPQESAVYGLLLRWSAQPAGEPDKRVAAHVTGVLKVLDRRFAAAPPREATGPDK